MSLENLNQINIDLSFLLARKPNLLLEQYRQYSIAFNSVNITKEIFDTARLKIEVLEIEIQDCTNKINELREKLK